jgi:hypothetical protein
MDSSCQGNWPAEISLEKRPQNMKGPAPVRPVRLLLGQFEANRTNNLLFRIITIIAIIITTITTIIAAATLKATTTTTPAYLTSIIRRAPQ